MGNQTIEQLKQIEIFSCLKDKELMELEPFIYHRTYKKGQYIFLEGDPRVRIYIILEGFVMLEKSNRKGSLLYNKYVKENEMFPYIGLFMDNEYSHTAIAETDVKVMYIMTEVFEKYIMNNKMLLQDIIKQMNQILQSQENRIQHILTPSAHSRVINTISYLMKDIGEECEEEVVIHCPMTAAKISVMSGTSRETASTVINKLKKDNIISVKEKILHIQDRDYFDELTK